MKSCVAPHVAPITIYYINWKPPNSIAVYIELEPIYSKLEIHDSIDIGGVRCVPDIVGTLTPDRSCWILPQ